MTFHTFGTLAAGNVPASYLDDNFTALAAAIVNYGVDTGTTNALAITTALTIAAYADGQVYAVKVANTNTSSATLNVDSLGTKNIYRSDTSALQPNDLVAGSTYILIYNAALNTNIGGFQMDGPPALSPSFHAHRSTNQNSGTAVVFDTVDNQIGTGYNNGTGVFTAPVTGMYLLAFSLVWTISLGGPVQFFANLNVNSIEVAGCGGIPLSATGTARVNCTSLCQMTAGQAAFVDCTTLTANQVIVGSTVSSFSGCLMYHT